MSLSKTQRTEQQKRIRTWHAAPFSPFDAPYQCACCRKETGLRLVKGSGAICKRCYIHASKCKVKGCNEIAVVDGECRNHFLGDSADDSDLHIDRFGARYSSSISQFQSQWGPV
ncbi:MAG: hypothetical protein GY854_21695 [Deltaproteobacteria bacterium]|nr:hypothetical protein [Deltaproteobacteria bacterium]